MDIGCAHGDYCGAFTSRSYRAVGLDINAELLKECNSLYPQVAPVRADAQALPFHKQSFDAIISTNVLRYIPDIVSTLTECNRIMKDNGRLVLICHNRLCPDTLLKKDPYVVRRYDIISLKRLLSETGFRVLGARMLLIPYRSTPMPLVNFILRHSSTINNLSSKVGFDKIFPEIIVYAVKERELNGKNT